MFKYKISVIVPIYNTGRYIVDAIESLVNQTFSDFEVVFIDDGSTDETGEFVKDYIEKNNIKNMKYVYQDNSGPSVARNRGLDIKQGEYVCFMDSDDKLPLNALELMYNKIIENDADIVVGGTYRFNSKTEWKVGSHFLNEGYKDIINTNELIWTMGPCNKLYRSDLLENIKFPVNISYGEDQCFVMEAYLKAKRIYAVDELVYYYRERDDLSDGSLTSQQIINPNAALNQVVQMWIIINDIIDSNIANKYDRDIIKERYLYRLIQVDVWGALKSALDTRDSKTQVISLTYILNLLKEINLKVFNSSFILHRLCTAWIIDRYLSLSNDARIKYYEITKYVFNNLHNEAYLRLQKKYPKLTPTLKAVSKSSLSKSKFIINRYLFVRKFKKMKKMKIDKLKKTLRNPILRIGGALRSIDENKIILATNKREIITDNLGCIEAKIKEVKPEITVNCYPKKNRNLLETIKMYWDFSNAKNILLDDYYNQLYDAKLHKDIRVIQLWHACGAFKRFGFSAVGKDGGNSLEFEKAAHNFYTHIITSSSEIIPHYKEAFGVNNDRTKVLPLGVPRTDILFDKEYISHVRRNINTKFKYLEGKKIIAYTPTFRTGVKGNKVFDNNIDFEYWCKNIPDDYILVFKLHPSVSKKGLVPKEYSDKIVDLSKSIDIQDLIMCADILITDYSSVVFEYALMDKPMIFFAYDLDSYMDDRNFYYKYEDLVPNKIVKTTEELVNAVINNSVDEEKLNEFKTRFLSSIDGKSTEKIVDFIINK